MGITFFRDAALTCSWATKSRGSLMARYRVSCTSFTGTTQNFRAILRGTYRASSTGMETAVRSTNSTPSWICSASMRFRSVMKPFCISTSPRRWWVSFWTARALSSCSCVMTPEAISRSPSRIYAISITPKYAPPRFFRGNRRLVGGAAGLSPGSGRFSQKSTLFTYSIYYREALEKSRKIKFFGVNYKLS